MAISKKNMKKYTCCTHGITDNVKICGKTIIENYEEGRRTVIYHYRCGDHNRYGNHSVEAPMPKT